MEASNMIIIDKDEQGNIKYMLNPACPTHEIIGALELVKSIVTQEIVRDTILTKTDNNKETSENGNNDSKPS